MKIEKLTKDNINEFIKDMNIEGDYASKIENNIDKEELYGIIYNNKYYIGFVSRIDTDIVDILYYNDKMSNEEFYEVIDFLKNNLVVENHLIIEVYEDKYMKLLEDKYKCKEVFVTYGDICNYELNSNKMKEKYADIDMMSIRYYGYKDIITCNLIKQNIREENVIESLHKYFIDNGIKTINLVIYNDNYEYIKEMGYECVSKCYVIDSVF